MSDAAVETLANAEARLVELRRQLAIELNSHPRIGDGTIDRFAKVQSAIEAIQRARKDEEARAS